MKYITCIRQSATTKVTVWAVRSFHVFGKKMFRFCNFNSKSTFEGTPPHFSNYCNIELILFVQTEDNTSYFLRIQHFLFSWNDPTPNDADGGGDGGGAPTTLPSWAQARAHPGQGTNIPFGETPSLWFESDHLRCIWPCVCCQQCSGCTCYNPTFTSVIMEA